MITKFWEPQTERIHEEKYVLVTSPNIAIPQSINYEAS
jgi:hypothetical protein